MPQTILQTGATKFSHKCVVPDFLIKDGVFVGDPAGKDERPRRFGAISKLHLRPIRISGPDPGKDTVQP